MKVGNQKVADDEIEFINSEFLGSTGVPIF